MRWPRPARVRLAIATCVTAFALLPATPALAGGGIQVSINGVPGPFISIATLGTDVDVAPNPIAIKSYIFGGPPATQNYPGTSVAEVARLAGVDPGSMTSAAAMVVHFPGTVTLSQDEVVSGFTNPLEAPSFPKGFAVFKEYDLDEVQFSRPMRTTTDTGDDGVEGLDGVVQVDLATAAPVLRVTAQADQTNVKPNVPVTFTAVPGAGQDANGWTYTWDFGDRTGTSASAVPTAQHEYKTAGTYLARVTVDHGQSGGVSPLVQIVVGAPVGDPGGDPGNGGGPGTAVPSTPGSSTAPTAAISGTGRAPADATSSGKNTSKDRKDVTGKDRGSGAHQSTAGPGKGKDSGSGSSTGTVASSGGSGQTPSSTTASTTTGTASTARSRAAGSAARSALARRPLTSGAQRIEGVLLAGDGSLASAVSSQRASAVARRQQHAARSGHGSSSGWVAWSAGVLALLALLAAGAALEQFPASRRIVYS